MGFVQCFLSIYGDDYVVFPLIYTNTVNYLEHPCIGLNPACYILNFTYQYFSFLKQYLFVTTLLRYHLHIIKWLSLKSRSRFWHVCPPCSQPLSGGSMGPTALVSRSPQLQLLTSERLPGSMWIPSSCHSPEPLSR